MSNNNQNQDPFKKENNGNGAFTQSSPLALFSSVSYSGLVATISRPGLASRFYQKAISLIKHHLMAASAGEPSWFAVSFLSGKANSAHAVAIISLNGDSQI